MDTIQCAFSGVITLLQKRAEDFVLLATWTHFQSLMRVFVDIASLPRGGKRHVERETHRMPLDPSSTTRQFPDSTAQEDRRSSDGKDLDSYRSRKNLPQLIHDEQNARPSDD